MLNSYLSLKKFRSTNLALGINCERLVLALVIDKSLNVSSLITAKLRLRLKLQVGLSILV